MSILTTRPATIDDVDAIRSIYNQGIEDRIATLEEDPKTREDVEVWLAERGERYAVLVAQGDDGAVLGWASLNPYSHRCAYWGVADLSVYVRRDARGRGVGTQLLEAIETRARHHGFHKIVLFTLPFNWAGQALYRRCGYREVGTFRAQGRLDGRFVDVMSMEKLLTEVP